MNITKVKQNLIMISELKLKSQESKPGVGKLCQRPEPRIYLHF